MLLFFVAAHQSRRSHHALGVPCARVCPAKSNSKSQSPPVVVMSVPTRGLLAKVRDIQSLVAMWLLMELA